MRMPRVFEAALTAAEFGEIIGVSERRVRELRDQKVIADNGSGRYVLGEAARSYCAHIRPASGQAAAGSGGASGLGDLTLERARLTAAQADLAEMKRAEMAGDLLAAADVERVWGDHIRRVRSSILAVPSRIRQVLGHIGDMETRVIDRELREALAALGEQDEATA